MPTSLWRAVALGVVITSVRPSPPAGSSPVIGCDRWKVVASPAIPASDLFSLAARGQNDIWAVGDNFKDGPPTMEHWDGTAWTRQGQAFPSGELHSVAAASDGTLWAFGIDFGSVAERLEGQTWVPHNPPQVLGGELWGSVALSSTDVWAVGEYTSDVIHGLTQHWDGTSWTTIPDDPLPLGEIFQGVSATGQTDIWAVGYGTGANLNSEAVAQHWDGSAWANSVVPNLGEDSVLVSVAAIAPDDAWAVGYFNYPGNPAQPLALHWDGTQWTSVSVPFAPGSNTSLYGVGASGPNDVWAVGGSDGPNGTRPIVEHWDGAAWSLQKPQFNSDQALLGAVLALGPHDVWASGTQINGSAQNPLIEHSRGCR